MRICDVPEDQIKIGMRVRSLTNRDKLGTIVEVDDPPYDTYWWIQWDGDTKAYSGFYWNDCECEIVQ
jgi:hypothetical protein